jgi:His/Glu/Gln/Arg/opine family amino acid ABC transporter permease subunit
VSWFTGLWSTAIGAGPDFVAGIWMTLRLLFFSTLCGVALSVPLALARISKNPLLRWPAYAYSVFFRGTPLIVQIFLIYYGLAQFSFVRDSFLWIFFRESYPCALIALSLNMTAYVGEVVRGGILSVPSGEREAAVAMGMGPSLLYRRIILPRAFGLMLPALGNEIVIQLKSTSLASTITLLDVTGVARRLAAATYQTDPLFVAAGIYVVLTYGLAQIFKALEARLNRFQSV